MQPELRYIVANGVCFAYLEQGHGPLVLLVHGFPDTARTPGTMRGRRLPPPAFAR